MHMILNNETRCYLRILGGSTSSSQGERVCDLTVTFYIQILQNTFGKFTMTEHMSIICHQSEVERVKNTNDKEILLMRGESNFKLARNV